MIIPITDVLIILISVISNTSISVSYQIDYFESATLINMKFKVIPVDPTITLLKSMPCIHRVPLEAEGDPVPIDIVYILTMRIVAKPS